MKYIIEHLEPRLYTWCFIEYEHISKIIGKENLIFTNLKTSYQRNALSKFGKIYKESITELSSTLFKKKLCLLDPNQDKTLKPGDKKNFDFLIFGGILGDNPPRKRTLQSLGHLNIAKRNLGNKQMATDNAVFVAKKIISGIPIKKIRFIDKLEIRIREGESIILPYRYVIEKGKPLISPKIIEYLKKKGF